jgi:predicted nucleotidyltransferase
MAARKEGESMKRFVLDGNVVAELCRQYAIKEIAVFGSVTRDDFRPDSDIDVC